jgi:hypothetical protein
MDAFLLEKVLRDPNAATVDASMARADVAAASGRESAGR